MNSTGRKAISLIATATFALSATPAFAAFQMNVATITYVPAGGPGAATAVPTLSGTLLIALAVLLLLAAFRVLKSSRQGSASLAVAVTTVAALVAGGGGLKLVADAQALTPPQPLWMSNANGGALEVPTAGDFEVFNSTSDAPLRIESITVAGGCSQVFPEAELQAMSASFVGFCAVGTTLAPASAEYCAMTIFCDAG